MKAAAALLYRVVNNYIGHIKTPPGAYSDIFKRHRVFGKNALRWVSL